MGMLKERNSNGGDAAGKVKITEWPSTQKSYNVVSIVRKNAFHQWMKLGKAKWIPTF